MSFESCWAKLQRAVEHRDALHNEISSTFAEQRNLPQVGTKYEAATGDHVVYVSRMPDLSDLYQRVSLLFGDSVHNLRTALDHVAYRLAALHTNEAIEEPRRIAFPITNSHENWTRARRQKLREVSPKHVAVIQWYQPFEALARGGVPADTPTILGHIRDLDDRDKHRLLTPVAAPASGLQNPHPQALAVWMPSALASLNDSEAYEINAVELGTVLARARLPDDVRLRDMEMAGHLAPRIHLLPQHVEVVSILDAMIERVTEIIRRFEAS